VAVPELPSDPALYVPTLVAAGYFESINFSEEDSKRAGFYQADAKRARLVNQSSDINSYLKSLDMEISFKRFDKKNWPRILQLISKSNQFNLTTKRYTQNDLLRFEADENYFTRQIRLKDIFGDNGMICVIICKKDKDAWEIDSWLMSCRVLERKVEVACLQDIAKNALASGAKKLIGNYIPTPHNIIVKEHYKKLGFSEVSIDLESETWELDIQDLEFQDIPIRTKPMDQIRENEGEK
jgi:FkbH-like protein